MTEEVKQPETSTRNCKCKLLTKIAILFVVTVLISSFLVPRLIRRFERRRHHRISCVNNLKQVGLGLMIYADENNDMFPNGKNFEAFGKLNALSGFQYLFCCPNSSQTPCKKDKKLTQGNISYIYLGGKVEKHPSNIPIAFDYPLNHKTSTGWFSKPEHYINVLFCDAHAESFKTEAKTCVAFIDVLHKKFKYSPEVLKRLKEKAAQADREQVPHKR